MKPKAPLAWEPVAFTKADAIAIKNLVLGKATEDQQKRALDWILTNACEIHGLSFRPTDAGGERGTSFAEGKRFVGLQICKLINHNTDNM